MEISSCFCVAAAAVSVIAALWTLKDGSGSGYWAAAFGAVGASLYFIAPPVVVGLVLLGCSFTLICVTQRRDKLLPLENRAVLITGCDSGFGHALAKRLSEMGVTVFAGVLDMSGDGAQRLRERASEKLQILQLDVTDSSQIESARHYICAQAAETGLWGLVNNAGVFLCPGDAELQPMAAYRLCMDVNFLGAVKMCQVFLPLLRRTRGRIVNVSSIAGLVPMPTTAAYGASKAALSIFSKVMSLDLSAWGVKVAVIQPAGFRTNIFGNRDDEARYRDEILATVSPEAREDYGEAYISCLPSYLTKMSQQSREDLSPVLDAMCHALLAVRPKHMYSPGQTGRLILFLHRCCPVDVFNAIITKLMKQTECEPAGLNKS